MNAKKEVEAIREYAGQSQKFIADLSRSLTELVKHLNRLPDIAAEAHKMAELEQRERELAEREREFAARMRRVDQLMNEGGGE